jgi:hypothetical protein
MLDLNIFISIFNREINFLSFFSYNIILQYTVEQVLYTIYAGLNVRLNCVFRTFRELISNLLECKSRVWRIYEDLKKRKQGSLKCCVVNPRSIFDLSHCTFDNKLMQSRRNYLQFLQI